MHSQHACFIGLSLVNNGYLVLSCHYKKTIPVFTNYKCLTTVQHTVALKRRLLRSQEKQSVSAE